MCVSVTPSAALLTSRQEEEQAARRVTRRVVNVAIDKLEPGFQAEFADGHYDTFEKYVCTGVHPIKLEELGEHSELSYSRFNGAILESGRLIEAILRLQYGIEALVLVDNSSGEFGGPDNWGWSAHQRQPQQKGWKRLIKRR